MAAGPTSGGRFPRTVASQSGNYDERINGTKARPRCRNWQTNPEPIHPISWNSVGKVPGGAAYDAADTPGIDLAAGQDEGENLASVEPKWHLEADPGSIQPVARNDRG